MSINLDTIVRLTRPAGFEHMKIDDYHLLCSAMVSDLQRIANGGCIGAEWALEMLEMLSQEKAKEPPFEWQTALTRQEMSKQGLKHGDRRCVAIPIPPATEAWSEAWREDLAARKFEQKLQEEVWIVKECQDGLYRWFRETY